MRQKRYQNVFFKEISELLAYQFCLVQGATCGEQKPCEARYNPRKKGYVKKA